MISCENGVKKEQLKNGEISEDEGKELSDKLQKMTDKYIKDIDKLMEEKSKEILTV